MKKREAAAALSADDRAKKKSKKLRIAAICFAAAFVLVLVLVLLHFFYFPLDYLWVKFSNPDIAARKEGELRVHFVDVGQGDAVIAELPDGGTMLIDAGSEAYASRSALLRYIHALGIGRFDYLVLTHPDEDHAGGMDDVLRCFGAARAFIPFATRYAPDSSYADVLDAIAEEGCATEIAHTYTALLSRSETYFYYMMFLSPFASGVPGSYYDIANEEGATDTDVNNASAVLWLEYAGRNVLLMGDITSEVEDRLAADYEVLGEECFKREAENAGGESVTLAPALDTLDFLKVAHHGSADSSSERFLSLTSPEAAFISVGAGNVYGHPSRLAVSRLSAAGAAVYRTDESGSIMLTISADGSYQIDFIGR